MEKDYNRTVRKQASKTSKVYDASEKYLIKVHKSDSQISSDRPEPVHEGRLQSSEPEKEKQKPVDITVKEKPSQIDLEMDSRNEKNEATIPLAFNLENVMLKELLDVVIVDFLGSSYVLEARPGAQISINLQGNFTPADMVVTLRAVLESLKLTLVNYNNVYHIVDANNTAGMGVNMKAIVRFPENIRVENLIVILKDIKSEGGKISTIQGSNILYMYDYPEIIARAESIVDAFDVPFFRNRYARVYSLTHAYAEDIAKEMENMLSKYLLFTGKSTVPAQIIPIERLKKIIVITSSKEAIDYLDSWISVLDEKHHNDQNLFFYRPKYAKSKDLIPFLNSVFPEKDEKNEFNFKSYVEEKSNVIIIRSSNENYQQARQILSTIDVAPRQVYIQALLAEVTLTDDMQMGFQWWFQDQMDEKAVAVGSTIGNLTSDIFKFSITADKFYGIMSNMMSQQEATIIATPHILVKDSEEASIEIKREVPVVKSFISSDVTQSGSSADQPTIEYKDAGIILKVNADILNAGEIELDIEQEVSSPSEVTLVGDLKSYEFSTRRVKTDVFLKNKETILIGGLLNEDKTDNDDKIPGLGNIPIIDLIFKTKNVESKRVELVLFLTPYVLSREDDLQAFSRQIAALMSSKGLQPQYNTDYVPGR